jgi:hypothetical protein
VRPVSRIPAREFTSIRDSRQWRAFEFAFLWAFLVCAASVAHGADALAQAGDVPLVNLALAEFRNLTPAERALLRFAGSYRSEPGGFAIAGTSAKPDDPSNDPADADKWGKEREVRAELIRWLCVDPRANAQVDPQGIRLLGARIIGKLNLVDVTIPFALTLRNCSIGERMTFEHASLPRLDLDGCYTGEIDGRAAVIRGDLNLDSIRASGEVWFNDSIIGGDLGARGGHFTHSKDEPHETEEANLKKALDLESSRIGGDVWLCYGFEADGAVNLITATIGTSVVFSGTFNNPNNMAIIGAGVAVASDVFFGAFFGKIRVNGGAFLGEAQIGRSVYVQDATFSGAPSEGLGFLGSTFHGFSVPGTSAKEALIWRNVALENGAVLNLDGASVGVLFDDPHSWPTPGKLIVDGFKYERLPDTRSRLRWLALQPEYHPQPYRQLAKVLRDQGDEEGAIAVLVASEDLRYASYGRASALWGDFLNVTIGYGHRPLRTIGWSLLVILIGWPIVWAAKRAGVMRPTWPENIPDTSEPDYEELHPLLYSLDAFLPFVNLHQEHYWWPNSKAIGDCVVFGYKFSLRGSLVRHYLWLQIFSGWLLSAILIAGVTGLMRSD